MKKTSKELIESINTFIPVDKQEDDNYITLLEDISDSIKETANDKKIAELENKIQTLENDKKELDKTWREKYINRFMGDVGDNNPLEQNNTDPESKDEETERAETIGIDDLFNVKE